MINAIVTDIEGTTSSLSFVKEVLFPYARKSLPAFIEMYFGDRQVSEQIEAVRAIMGRPDASLEQVVSQLIDWIDRDQKVTPLKTLQGLIWEAGYHNGDFHGHVYDDAVEALRRWREAGVSLYVYSSGSVYAQKLLFAHTEHGDLTPLFSGYFDTHVGAKQEKESYTEIALQIGLNPGEILFLSDVPAELDAAALAGFRVVQLARPGEAGPAGAHHIAESFAQIDLAAFC
ncbi:MAG TPA: acireductone synthase [Gammaproteobacteria bacterium]